MRNLRNAGKMSLINRRRGAVIVEMAFVAPVFFLLIFGLIEFTRMAMVQDALADAARIGCREAVLASTVGVDATADVKAKVRSSLMGTLACAADVYKCVVTIDPNLSGVEGVEPGTKITTSIEVKYADVSWLPPSFLGSVVLRGSAIMRRE